jgi:predicted RNA methylase
MFHASLAHGPGDLASIRTLEEMKGSGALTQGQILDEWRAILKVNYWPIFDIARRIFEVIPSDLGKGLCETLANTATKLVENSLTRSHDLTGAVFQKLIADRKFLAAYYTTPASAALMIGLLLDRDQAPNGFPWSDQKKVEKLKVGDFACGTGTLLSTAYTRLGQYYELHGNNSENIHPAMMASVLVGADVLPAAAHLTAAMLSGVHPQKTYTDSLVMTVPYGAQKKDKYALGSLDLLASQKTIDAVGATSLGAKGEKQHNVFVSVAHDSFDMVIMNPPFTRDTGQEADKVGVSNSSFAAFSASKADQTAMAKTFKTLLASLEGGHCHDGQAGEATGFIELGHRKLKAGGGLGLITPLSLMSGEAWHKPRQKIAANYDHVILLSITGQKSKETSFSADTGMAEAMTVGIKRKKAREDAGRATYVVLDDRPSTPLDGYATAKAVRRLIDDGDIRQIEDAPMGGSAIMIGSDKVGEAIEGPLPQGDTWDICRIADLSLAQTA